MMMDDAWGEFYILDPNYKVVFAPIFLLQHFKRPIETREETFQVFLRIKRSQMHEQLMSDFETVTVNNIMETINIHINNIYV